MSRIGLLVLVTVWANLIAYVPAVGDVSSWE
jgi:hypothetical protein